jgi:hypothetical protein
MLLQVSAEKLGQNAIQYEESPRSIVEAAKKIASMWMKMAQLIRSDLSILIAQRLLILHIAYLALYPRQQPWFNCDIHQGISLIFPLSCKFSLLQDIIIMYKYSMH